jgi:hypothetical protein
LVTEITQYPARLCFAANWQNYEILLILNHLQFISLIFTFRCFCLNCAHEPSFVRNLGLPLQRSSNRNREFNAWSQEHKDNPGVCQDYQGKIEQRRGKVVSAD